MTPPAPRDFYVIGGTLRPDAPCYIERKADSELLEGLLAHDFCYVLTSRQMGKSSLMVRTVGRLREKDHAVAVLDLTAIGQNLTVDQWYLGLLERLGAQLGIEDELEDHWELSSQLSPVQRWFSAVREAGLKATEQKGGLVIFIDEIDSVRSLPFSTDEFFSAIRECYNSRANDPRNGRLTFCLLGVATPFDLIRDTRTTPFNIGRRIDLLDFTRKEAAPLADGLKQGRGDEVAGRLLDRVLYWTHGQPYLTQRFCQAVAENPKAISPAQIDRICASLFLSQKARERNDNLIFVRERILRGEADLAALLDLYGKIWKGRREPDDPSNPLVCALRLSGITRAVGGRLEVRNRIYRSVFDEKWARASMPDAELRRQREAYVSGIVRTAAVSAAMLLAISFFAALAIYQKSKAEENSSEAIYQKSKAEAARREAVRAARQLGETLARMEIQQAETALRAGRSSEGIAHLAHILRGEPTNTVAAAWLVSALSQRSFARPTFRRNDTPAVPRESPFYSPDGERVIASMGNEAHILNLKEGEIVAGPMTHGGIINDAREFSPDGGRVALGSADNMARIWDAHTGQPLTPPMRHAGQVSVVRFSPDGLRLLTVTLNRVARVWDGYTGHPLCEPFRTPRDFGLIQFSADGKRLVMEPAEPRADREGRARGRPSISWDVRPGGMRGLTLRHRGTVDSAEFGPDSRRVLTASHDGSSAVWDARTGERLTPLMEHELRLYQACFSPDGKLAATASEDRTARIWNAADGSPLTAPLEHDGPVFTVEFSPDGRLLATASEDGTARVWRVGSGESASVFTNGSPTLSAAFSPDGKTVMTASTDRRVRLWDTETGREKPGGFQVEFGRRRMGFFRRGRGRPTNETADSIMARFSGDGASALTLVNGRFSSDVRVWRFASNDWLSEGLDHNSFVRSARFDPESRRIVTASEDRTARIWDVATGNPVGSAMEHGSEVLFAGYFPDARRIFTFSAADEARIWDAETGMPLSEPYAVAHEHLYREGFGEPHHATSVSPDGRWLVAPGGEMALEISETLTPDGPAPEWLLDLAEATAGRRVDARGLFENTPPFGPGGANLLARIEQAGDGFYGRWAKWFLAGREERTISPSSRITVAQRLEKLISSGTVEGLREALHIEPDMPQALARLADSVVGDVTLENERALGEALFFGRRAAEVSGDDPDAWLAHAGRAIRLKVPNEARRALKQAEKIAEKTGDEDVLEDVRSRADDIREQLQDSNPTPQKKTKPQGSGSPR